MQRARTRRCVVVFVLFRIVAVSYRSCFVAFVLVIKTNEGRFGMQASLMIRYHGILCDCSVVLSCSCVRSVQRARM